jgi:hypothetical protein
LRTQSLNEGGRGKKRNLPETSGFSRQRLGQARQILNHSRELALQVFHGTEHFDVALETAVEAQKIKGVNHQ